MNITLNGFRMKILLRILLTGLAVLAIAYILEPRVHVENYGAAIWVAVVLGILRFTVKPLLIFFTLPATIITFGLFLFVINAVIILMAGYFVSGFEVSGFWIALLFSILLSIFQSFLYSLFDRER